MRSSTLSPKIHRYSMFPPACMKPPCRNIDEKTATQENAAGTRPKYRMNSLTCSPSDS
ncbi:hypothetical protein D3C83_241980 [compost metagenome]